MIGWDVPAALPHGPPNLIEPDFGSYASIGAAYGWPITLTYSLQTVPPLYASGFFSVRCCVSVAHTFSSPWLRRPCCCGCPCCCTFSCQLCCHSYQLLFTSSTFVTVQFGSRAIGMRITFPPRISHSENGCDTCPRSW